MVKRCYGKLVDEGGGGEGWRKLLRKVEKRISRWHYSVFHYYSMYPGSVSQIFWTSMREAYTTAKAGICHEEERLTVKWKYRNIYYYCRGRIHPRLCIYLKDDSYGRTRILLAGWMRHTQVDGMRIQSEIYAFSKAIIIRCVEDGIIGWRDGWVVGGTSK